MRLSKIGFRVRLEQHNFLICVGHTFQQIEIKARRFRVMAIGVVKRSQRENSARTPVVYDQEDHRWPLVS